METPIKGWITETSLGDITDMEYDEWYGVSKVINGVRFGPPVGQDWVSDLLKHHPIDNIIMAGAMYDPAFAGYLKFINNRPHDIVYFARQVQLASGNNDPVKNPAEIIWAIYISYTAADHSLIVPFGFSEDE